MRRKIPNTFQTSKTEDKIEVTLAQPTKPHIWASLVAQ